MAMLAVSFLVTAACVFFLGFYVGKRNAAAHVGRDDRVARIPVDDFSKYSRPSPAVGARGAQTAEAAQADQGDSARGESPARQGGAHVKGGGKAAAGAAAAKTDPKAAAGGDGAADKPGQTSGSAAPALVGPPDNSKAEAAAAAKPPLAASDAKAAAAGPQANAATAVEDSGDRKSDPKAAAAKNAEAKAAEAKAAEAKSAESAKSQEDSGKAGAGGYTVQVLATRKQGDAEALVKKLASRGYGAYIKRVSDGQTSWYRVRVGRYVGFGEARTMADRCRRDLGLEQAFVSTE